MNNFMENPYQFSGIRIIESSYTPEFTYKTIKRTWKERFFTRPFRPFQKTKSVVSGRAIFQTYFGIVVHPSTAAVIRENITS